MQMTTPCLSQYLFRMDMYWYTQQTNKNSKKTHSSSPVQCSIPVVHSTVCTHPVYPMYVTIDDAICNILQLEKAQC